METVVYTVLEKRERDFRLHFADLKNKRLIALTFSYSVSKAEVEKKLEELDLNPITLLEINRDLNRIGILK